MQYHVPAGVINHKLFLKNMFICSFLAICSYMDPTCMINLQTEHNSVVYRKFKLDNQIIRDKDFSDRAKILENIIHLENFKINNCFEILKLEILSFST